MSAIRGPKPRTSADVTSAVPATSGSFDTADTAEVSQTRAQFRDVEFTRALRQHGKVVMWRKAMICPCVRPDTERCEVDCVDCDGSGFVYVDPIEIQAHMAAFSEKTRIYEKFGLWASGEVQVTTFAANRLGYRDSLEMKHELMVFNELIVKGDRHGRRAQLGPDIDSARYRIVNLTRVLVRSKDGVLPLEVGYHVKVTPSGHLEWLAPGQRVVPDGARVSIHYDFHPTWIVTSHPHATRTDLKVIDGQEKVIGLPLQVGAQLDFLADVNRKLPTTGA